MSGRFVARPSRAGRCSRSSNVPRCSRCRRRATSSRCGSRPRSTSITTSSTTPASTRCPHRLVARAVEVRATAAVVEIFHRGRRVTSHVREYGRQRFITKPEHMPAAHRAHLEWTPSRLIAWGRSIGPAVAELVETILNTRPHPEHGYRACLGLKRLVKRYGPERMTAACQRALATGGISYSSVQRHPEERPGSGAGRHRAIGQGGADPACQSARIRLLPADAAGGLSHAASTRPSTSSTRWGCSAWRSGCANNSSRASTRA